jgi:hypothetical protein
MRRIDHAQRNIARLFKTRTAVNAKSIKKELVNPLVAGTTGAVVGATSFARNTSLALSVTSEVVGGTAVGILSVGTLATAGILGYVAYRAARKILR